VAEVTPEELRATFDDQVRLHVQDQDPARVAQRVGPLFRSYAKDPRGWACVESPTGLGNGDPRDVIESEVRFFSGRGQAFEWKTYDYDPPGELGALLLAAGFERGDDEALILGELAALAVQSIALPAGMTLREIDRAEDLVRMGQLHQTVWGEDHTDMTDALVRRWEDDPTAEVCVIIEERRSGPVLCAARATFDDSDFVGMWGGSTLPDWRRRGLYRATLGYRARLGIERGKRFARVDASPDSEPILRRLGLHRAGTTVPYVWSPNDNST
jgi:hypothetical protein